MSFRVSPPNHAAASRASHRLTIDVSDVNGNTAEQAVSTFRVAPPTMDPGGYMISLPTAASTTRARARSSVCPSDQVLVVRWLPTDATPGDKYHWWGGATGVQDQYAGFEPLDAEEPYVVSDPLPAWATF